MAYITQTLLEAYFGTSNIASWSNTENDSAGADTAKIATSIAVGEEYVEDRFREGAYTVPFVAIGGSYPAVLMRWMIIFAGADLYEARGLQDSSTDDADEEQNKISRLKTRADSEMDRYLQNASRFNLQKAAGTNVTAPSVAR